VADHADPQPGGTDLPARAKDIDNGTADHATHTV